MDMSLIVNRPVALVLNNGTTLEGTLHEVTGTGVYLSPIDDGRGVLYVPWGSLLYIQQEGIYR